jgi:deazaflavin-dependent oxidoreductase (nitroreductase family)
MSSPHSWNQDIIDEFRANDGNVTSRPFGRNLILVHHIGAKSGVSRVSPVMGIREGDGVWLIAASKAGAPENPGWFHNLLANPDTTIEVPGEGFVEVRAEQLKGEDRDRAWARFTARSPGFRDYETRTTRTIPVLALRRR